MWMETFLLYFVRANEASEANLAQRQKNICLTATYAFGL